MRTPALRPAAIGGFTLGGLALVVAAILFFGSGQWFSRTSRAVVFFEGSVGGLTPGVPVTFRGVQVGSVVSVSLVIDPRDMKARIPVYLKIEPNRVVLADAPRGSSELLTLQRAIAAGLRARLVLESFVTGQMLVDLDLDPGTPAVFVGGGKPGVPEIPAVRSDLQTLRDQVMKAPIGETIAQARSAFAAIETLANRISADLDPMMTGLQGGIASFAQTMDTGRSSVVRLQQDASSTLGEAKALAHEAREQLSARGAEVSRVMRAAEQTLRAADTLLASADSLVMPRSRARDDFEAALRDLAASLSSLRDFTHTIDRDPSALVRGRNGP